MRFYDGSGHSTFVVGIASAPRYACGIFAKGYRRAAEVVARQLLEKPHFSDYEGYPVAFLYRHAFELHLKNVIYQSARLAAFQRMDDIDAALYNTHSLVKLSQAAMTILVNMFGDDAALKEVAADVRMIAADLAEIDEGSYSYRYPIDRSGNLGTKPHQRVDLEALYRGMERILEQLEVIDFGLDVETSNAQETYELLEKLTTSLRLQ